MTNYLNGSGDDRCLHYIRSATHQLARHDQEHGTAAGPIPPDAPGGNTPLGQLRAYVRQEYTAWCSPGPGTGAGR